MVNSVIWPSCSAATWLSSAIDSSSVPSPPCTSQADVDPRSRSTSAMGRSQSALNAPVSWRRTPAGLVSGPNRLKTVRVPSSVRGGPTWRIAGWCIGAIMKQMPAWSSARCATAGPPSTLMPIWVSASAAPDFDDRFRLPCLATGTPAPATTKAVAVEMFSVPLPSPPVPTMSIAPSGAVTRFMRARMARAAAAISSTVSPRTRKAISRPPIWAGVAAPSNSAEKAASASDPVRGRSAARPIRGRMSVMRRPCGRCSGPGSCGSSRVRTARRWIRGGTARPRSAGRNGSGP